MLSKHFSYITYIKGQSAGPQCQHTYPDRFIHDKQCANLSGWNLLVSIVQMHSFNKRIVSTYKKKASHPQRRMTGPER